MYLRVLDKMGSLDPAYQGMRARMEQYWVKEKAYTETWKKQNPGETLDWNDEEHTEWRAKNMPGDEKFDKLFAKAEQKLEVETAVERALQEERKRNDEKIRKVESKYEENGKMAKLADEIKGENNQFLADMITTAAPEFKDIIYKDGKIDLSDAAEKAINEANEEMGEIIKEESAKMDMVAFELGAFARLGPKVKFDMTHKVPLPSGDSFFPHAEIYAFSKDLDTQYSKLPAGEDQGRRPEVGPDREGC